MKKNCLECRKEFEAQRVSTKFCSQVCRVKYNREEMKKFLENLSEVSL